MSYTPKLLRESPNQRNYSAFTHPGTILYTTILSYWTGTVTDTPRARFSADMILVYQVLTWWLAHFVWAVLSFLKQSLKSSGPWGPRVYISPAQPSKSSQGWSSPPCPKAPTTHFVPCWRLRCVRSERMGTDGSPLSPLIHQEPTASLACSVICLQATLLRKLPRSSSGPYAVLQSWPWCWP